MSETSTEKNTETQQNQGVSDEKTNLKDTKKRTRKKKYCQHQEIG